jgi:DNA-directed RNA polymerase subunit RPC12/RpoP
MRTKVWRSSDYIDELAIAKRIEEKSYYCMRCDLDFEAKDELEKGRAVKCTQCLEGKYVIRAKNPLRFIGEKHEKNLKMREM